MQRRGLISCILALACALIVRDSLAGPAELIMFEQAGCVWCARWRAEIGPAYPRTPEGQKAPLRAIDMHGEAARSIAIASPIPGSPTFVLMHDGREIGRIVGYPGNEFFWGLFSALVQRLPADAYPAGSR